MAEKNFDVLFKILLIGDMGVGKSCILLRYSEDVFNAAHVSTIGVDFKIRTLEKNNKVVKLQIWDTAGQERFRTITQSYYKGAHGVILVYDITRRETFDNVATWLQDVKNFAIPNIGKVLVANKSDLESQRQVSREEGEQYAQRLGIPFLETSAKNKDNVENAFGNLIDEIFKQKYEDSITKTEGEKPITIDPGKKVKSKGGIKCIGF